MGDTFMVFILIILLVIFPAESQGELEKGFYSSTCPKVENIVRSTVDAHFKTDPTIAAGLLRLHFHDCFVQGCDGSILLTGPSSEKTALQNLGLRGFEVIDEAKRQLESVYPGVVSCADILALAARDSVDLSGGPSWGVPTGRTDGRISRASEATSLPSPLEPIAIHRQKFADKGLDDRDLVTLSATGNSDPSISQSFLTELQTICPKNGDGSNRVALDKDSQFKFDVSYFENVRDGNGILESDQRLWGDAVTRKIVDRYAGNWRGLLGLKFDFEFQKSMVR